MLLVRGQNSMGWPAGPGGGGEAPAWAREGSYFDIDFVNDPPRAHINGTEYNGDLTELFGTSVDYPAYVYDPEQIDPGIGYGDGTGSSFFAATATLAAAFVFDFSVVAEYTSIAAQSSIEWTEATFGTDLFFVHRVGTEWAVHDYGMANNDETLDAPTTGTVDVLAKSGITVTADECFAAGGGSQFENALNPGVFTIDPTTPNNPTDVLFRFAKLKRLTGYNGANIKSLVELQALTV